MHRADRDSSYSKVYKIFAAFWLSILLGVVVPGFVAYFSGTFFQEDVEEKTPSSVRDKYKALDARIVEQAATKQALEDLAVNSVAKAASIGSTEAAAEANAILDLLGATRREFAALSTEREKDLLFRPRAFLLDTVRILWPTAFFFFSVLALVLPPPCSRTQVSRRWLPLFAVIWLTHRTPTWIRNSSIGDLGRKTWNAANWDISPVGFFLQEATAVILCLLLSLVWAQWLSHSDQSADRPATYPEARALLQRRAAEWSVATLCLLGGFVYYTFFFWERVGAVGDYRFILHAVIVHMLWLGSLVIVSQPLKHAYARFQDAARGIASGEVDPLPIAWLPILGAGVAAASSVVGVIAPLFELLG